MKLCHVRSCPLILGEAQGHETIKHVHWYEAASVSLPVNKKCALLSFYLHERHQNDSLTLRFSQDLTPQGDPLTAAVFA